MSGTPNVIALEDQKEKISLLDQRVYDIAQSIAECNVRIEGVENKVEHCQEVLSRSISDHKEQVSHRLDQLISSLAKQESSSEGLLEIVQKLQEQEIQRKAADEVKEKNKKMLIGLVLTGGGAGLTKLIDFLSSFF
jgi:chromosome segregation ATPase